jgi:hypothetical protein
MKAVPFEGSGNYKGHSTTTQGVTIRCGWQWWHTCFGIVGGVIWVDDYDHVIGNVCVPANNTPPTNDYLSDNLQVGSMVAEDGSMESWYQFSNLEFTPN